MMISISALFLRAELHLMKPFVKKMSITGARKGQDALGSLGAAMNLSKVRFHKKKFDKFEAAWAVPKECRGEKRAILYLHGGAYTAGKLRYTLGFGSILAEETQRRVLCVAYRLAPENVFPAAVEDALEAYRYMMECGYSPDNIALCGESAGGGLVFALTLRLKQLGMPLPYALVGISPWTDLALTGNSYTKNRYRDPTLDKNNLLFSAELYAEGKLKEPLVSPLYGELSNMPPSLIFAGTDELLLDDSVSFHKRLIACGNQSELIVEHGMWHVYVLLNIPEAVRARKRIVEFIN